jgi:3',5'-cyclic AMP phosphodiesterase CpdA
MLLGLALTACSSHSITGPADADDRADTKADRSGFSPPYSSDPGLRFTTDPELKVAFFGDQGVNAQARRVLQLVADEHTDAVIHLGDLSYGDATPSGWEAQLNEVLGADFPYFVAIGNHDVNEWPGEDGFDEILRRRLSRMTHGHCDGEYGVKATCTFRGLSFVVSGIGTVGSGHEDYLDAALQGSHAAFRVCTWHKNQHDMQVGAKTDEVGWEAYRVCERQGVPIITGHEHSYSRTQSLSGIGVRERLHGATGETSSIQLAPGRTFVVVSGLGGKSEREQGPSRELDGWWASIYAKNMQLRNGSLVGTEAEIQAGALFVIFHADGDPYKARAYFKTVDGEVQDELSWWVPERDTP